MTTTPAETTAEVECIPAIRLRRRMTGRLLAEVAKVYRAAWQHGDNPTKTVAAHFNTSHSSAARWVGLAREAGELGSANGSRGGEVISDVGLDLDPDYVPVPVAGNCPMCGSHLELDYSNRIRCVGDGGNDSFALCADQYAVHKLLDDPERDHIVRIEGDRFHLKHPLSERVDDQMLSCRFHSELSNTATQLPAAGTYRVRRAGEYLLTFEVFA